MRGLVALTAFALLTSQPAIAEDKSVDNAFYLCALIDNTGFSSAPCDVSGWGSKVIATIDTSGGEARKMCDGMAKLMRSQGRTFNGWTLVIQSPFSNGTPIAYCSL